MPIDYHYRDANNMLRFTIRRHVPKRFDVIDAKGQILPGNNVQAPAVLYRLPELLASPPDAMVIVVEGEKDVETLRTKLGLDKTDQPRYAVTTNPCGCLHGWHPAYSACLQDRVVVILPDNDRPGIRHAKAVFTSLQGVARAVSIVRLPRLKGAEDVTDWFERRGGSVEELESLLQEARTCVPAKKEAPHGVERRRRNGRTQAEKQAHRKRRSPANPEKKVRFKAYWGVFTPAMKRVALYEYADRKAAEQKAKELSVSQKTPHFVSPVKEPIEE